VGGGVGGGLIEVRGWVGERERKTRVGQDALSFSVPKRKMKSKLKSRYP
jgi:hypothetical protein